ncbi:hypothetical protein Zmor_011657 [Zophobas morio]|uniref:Peptidase S1 domain-containing protein n=1 Tax=Zophobas morio TaxID=2755281 RepID=A0AA38IVS4_9CUCU|nr:hypothetical protein Zmor_011657 [Zophobas morio]
MRVFLIICLALITIKTTHNAPEPRIDGGQEAIPHSIPYQVFLQVFTTSTGWYCGGVLISANYVLTAAQCIHSTNIAYVFLGVHNLTQQEDTHVFKISNELIIHQNFNISNWSNDIALIKLPESVEFTDAIQPVALPRRSDVDNYFVGAIGIASGWGLTDFQEDYLSDVLNYVEVKVITNRDCHFQDGESVVDSMLCTSGLNHRSTCIGDNGGPLVVDGVFIGIIFYHPELCGDSEAPSIYTRITSFLNWIEENSDVIIG